MHGVLRMLQYMVIYVVTKPELIIFVIYRVYHNEISLFD